MIIPVLATGKHKLSLCLHPMVHSLIPKQSRVTHSQYWQIFFPSNPPNADSQASSLIFQHSRPQSMWTTNLTNPSTLHLFSPHRRQTWASGITTLGRALGRKGTSCNGRHTAGNLAEEAELWVCTAKSRNAWPAVSSLPWLVLQLCRVWRKKSSPSAETESWFLLHPCF